MFLDKNQFQWQISRSLEKQFDKQKFGDFTFIDRRYYVDQLADSLSRGKQQNVFSELYREHFQQTYAALNLFKSLAPVESHLIEQKKNKTRRNPNFRYQKTIIFDLDETLVHCNDNNSDVDTYVTITFPNGESVDAGINIRPFASEILKELSSLCEVFVFTASHSCYGEKIINYLDPQGEFIQGKFYRDDCIQTQEGVYIKNLLVINRDLKETVLIDNAAYSFGYQIENGIPIIPFYDNKMDNELQQLMKFLKDDILPAKDVRTIIKQSFQFHRLSEFISPLVAAQQLYSVII